MMVSTVFYLGLALVVAVPGATGSFGNETTARLTNAKGAQQRNVESVDRKEAAERPRRIRPSRSVPRPPRPEGRPTFVPGGSSRKVVSKARREQNTSPRRRAVVQVPAGDRKTIVMHLEHAPAVCTVETIRKWLESEEAATGRAAATVVAVTTTNQLVISGAGEQLEAIRSMVHELDRPATQIRVKAMLIDLTLPNVPQATAAQQATGVSQGDMGAIVAKLKKRGDLRMRAQLQLLCVDSQPASIQFGSRVPRITGAGVSSRGRVNQTTQENVGMILGVTARVTEDDLVVLQVDIERSHLGPEAEGTPVATAGEGSVVVRAPQVQTMTVQTTVSLHSGQTVVLGGTVDQTAERCGERLVLLHTEIVR